MKKTIIKFFDKIIVILLCFIGVFTSCSKSESKDESLKYGMPPTEYNINENNDFEDITKGIKSEDIELQK